MRNAALLATIVFLLWLCPGCANSGRVGTAENRMDRIANVTGPTSQPVTIDQDAAAVLAKVQKLQTEVNALKSVKTVTYGSDVWLGRLAVVMAACAFAFARWQAVKHGYKRQRDRRLAKEKCERCGGNLN